MSHESVPDLWAANIANQSPTLIAVSVLFHSISTIFFAARITWRIKHRQKGWDDFMATVAWITLFVQTTFGAMAAHYGFGKHRIDIVTTFSRAMFYFYLYQICYMVLGVFTKLTFCFLYLRLFHTHQRFRKVVWWTTGLIVVGGSAFTLATVWQCTPIKRAWSMMVNGTCTDKMAFWYSHAAFNTLLDIVVFILPIPLIGTLQMARKSRLSLMFLFSFGAFVVAASIVRMVYLKQFAQSNSDDTWDSMPALIWTEIESNTAMICCCLPALGSLAAKTWCGLRGKPLNTPSTSAAEATPRHKDFAGQIADRRSFGQGLQYLGQDPGLGNFVDIHYSPPRSAIFDLDEDRRVKNSSPFNGASRWLRDMLSSISGIGSSASKSSIPSYELHQIPADGNLAPKLELGTVSRTRTRGRERPSSPLPLNVGPPLWQQSASMDTEQEQRGKKLTARDARAKHVNMGGLSGFLREGGINGDESTSAPASKTIRREWPSPCSPSAFEDISDSSDLYAVGKGQPRGKEAGW